MIKQISMFQLYVDQIKQAITSNFKGKKQCVANAIFSNGKVLLLKRSSLDEFHPGTWCLPGGGVDAGEFPLEAVKRETKEECGLNKDEFEIYGYWLCELPNVVIHYYASTLRDPWRMNFLYLDNKEHVMAKWCDDSVWTEMDLILQLKEHMFKMFKNVE